MLESFLVAGRQEIKLRLETLTYGQSITDGCIGWDTTVEVLDRLASKRSGPAAAPTPQLIACGSR